MANETEKLTHVFLLGTVEVERTVTDKPIMTEKCLREYFKGYEERRENMFIWRGLGVRRGGWQTNRYVYT